MPKAKAGILYPTDYYKKIHNFIARKNGNEFFLEEMAEETSVPKRVISACLREYHTKGYLKRVKRNDPPRRCYRYSVNLGMPKLRAASAEIADLVWKIFKNNEPHFLKPIEVIKAVERISGKYYNRGNISKVISIWHRNGYLEKREGKNRQHNVYQFKPGVEKRPSASNS